MEFLGAESKKYPALSARYDGLADLYSQKLWHQLTVELQDFVLDKSTWKGQNLISLYDKFISTIEEKLNPLKLAQILTVISRQFLTSIPPKEGEVNGGILFLEKVAAKLIKEDEAVEANANNKKPLGYEEFGDSVEAVIILKMGIAEMYLAHPDIAVFRKKCLDFLRVIETKYLPKLEGSGNEAVANSAFYRVRCEYFKLVGPAGEFYKSAIQFLGFTPHGKDDTSVLSKEKQESMAVDIALAALVATSTEEGYNFGEVLPQPILNVLEGTEHQWLVQLLDVFNSGDIEGFAKLFQTHESKFQEYSILAQNMEVLRQKIGLMALMRIVFHRVSGSRTIELDEIAREVKLESNMVEWMIMKAMSKGLIKGRIDGVNRTVSIDWLKPRVLTPDQLGLLETKLQTWSTSVSKTYSFLLNETPELFQ